MHENMRIKSFNKIKGLKDFIMRNYKNCFKKINPTFAGRVFIICE